MHKLILTFLFLFCLAAHSQDTDKDSQPFPIYISVMDESISLPDLSFLKYSYNPAVMVGTEYRLKAKKNNDWHLTANLGYYYHKNWQAAVFLNSEIGYRYKPNRWSIYSRFGLGYAHAFSTKPVFKYNGSVFTEANDAGSPLLMTSLSLNTSFEILNKPFSPEVYFTYMFSAEIPFNIYSSLHHFVGVGYKFYPFNTHSK